MKTCTTTPVPQAKSTNINLICYINNMKLDCEEWWRCGKFASRGADRYLFDLGMYHFKLRNLQSRAISLLTKKI